MKRILTGDRTTGKLHLGHYVGSLRQRVALQHDYDTFILLADVQALTTHFDNPELINSSILDVAIDNLSVGLDPEKVTIIQQSMIPSIAELTIFYSMITTVNHLLINPTIKSEARNYGFSSENAHDYDYDFSKLSYGFLGYPVSQTADITFCNADLVPVGEDQVPHIELSRKIVRKFNALYGTEITEPDYKLSSVSRLCGLDGNAKMGKSLGNAIYLSDTKEDVEKKVRSAVTDTNRVSVKIPGNPDVCTVYQYHKAFNEAESGNICSMCKNAQIGCVACKKMLASALNAVLDPIREKRAYYESHISDVKDIIKSGTDKANRIGNENIRSIKEKMHVLI
ncbi:MAG TPA: tryptophan--tRNA ligase [Candidatus Ornithospirochaeta avicola]|uniref:Tryptophan--tRNA ligase n=1 Tax=Candidatus Ornithospirochaeta avicola TaxID=2840896 RepID=A0A9D1PVN1_9SPIO|nr:tryptophan--tRNA ligase [Candidatus Ornithospirochaeta avicola]